MNEQNRTPRGNAARNIVKAAAVVMVGGISVYNIFSPPSTADRSNDPITQPTVSALPFSRGETLPEDVQAGLDFQNQGKELFEAVLERGKSLGMVPDKTNGLVTLGNRIEAAGKDRELGTSDDPAIPKGEFAYDPHTRTLAYVYFDGTLHNVATYGELTLLPTSSVALSVQKTGKFDVTDLGMIVVGGDGTAHIVRIGGRTFKMSPFAAELNAKGVYGDLGIDDGVSSAENPTYPYREVATEVAERARVVIDAVRSK